MPCSASGLEAGGPGETARAPGSGGRRRGRACLIALFFTSTLLSSCSSNTQDGFRVVNVTTHSHQGQRLVDAKVSFDFSSDAREALENGVAITVYVDLQLQTRGNLWQSIVASSSAGQQIHIYALSKQYQVKNLTTGQSRTYRSFTDMAANIGIIKNQFLIDELQLVADQQYLLKARARLAIESLPSPLRPLAYLSASWQLSSDWSTWPFQP